MSENIQGEQELDLNELLKIRREKSPYSTSNIWKSKNYWLQCTTFKEMSNRSTTKVMKEK